MARRCQLHPFIDAEIRALPDVHSIPGFSLCRITPPVAKRYLKTIAATMPVNEAAAILHLHSTSTHACFRKPIFQSLTMKELDEQAVR